MSEIRYDIIHDEYVIIAPERLHRPIVVDFRLKDDKVCPFCLGNESLTTREIMSIRVNNQWKARVIPNLYKAVAIERPLETIKNGMNEGFNGFGVHEIVVDTPKHEENMSRLTEEDIFFWLKAIRLRIMDLKNDKRIVYLNIFKNHGPKAGATQTHPHTQIIGLPILSESQINQFTRFFKYYKEHGRKLLDDVSRSSKPLIETKNFRVFTPYASAFPFELIISSNRYSLETHYEEELKELATVIRCVYKAYFNIVRDMQFNLIFYIPPINENFQSLDFFLNIPEFFRFFIRLTPRIYGYAGFEFSSRMQINPVAPEDAHNLLKRELNACY